MVECDVLACLEDSKLDFDGKVDRPWRNSHPRDIEDEYDGPLKVVVARK